MAQEPLPERRILVGGDTDFDGGRLQPLSDSSLPACEQACLGNRSCHGVSVLTTRPAQDRRARLMIDDALPAGVEIDPPAIQRAGDIRALGWLDSGVPEHTGCRAVLTQKGGTAMRIAYVERAVSSGMFDQPAARVQDMYHPGYRATIASGDLEIR